MARACTGLPLHEARLPLVGRSIGMVTSSVRVTPFWGCEAKRRVGSSPEEQSVLTQFIAAIRASLSAKTSRLNVRSERAWLTDGAAGFADWATAGSGIALKRLRHKSVRRMARH